MRINYFIIGLLSTNFISAMDSEETSDRSPEFKVLHTMLQIDPLSKLAQAAFLGALSDKDEEQAIVLFEAGLDPNDSIKKDELPYMFSTLMDNDNISYSLKQVSLPQSPLELAARNNFYSLTRYLMRSGKLKFDEPIFFPSIGPTSFAPLIKYHNVLRVIFDELTDGNLE